MYLGFRAALDICTLDLATTRQQERVSFLSRALHDHGIAISRFRRLTALASGAALDSAPAAPRHCPSRFPNGAASQRHSNRSPGTIRHYKHSGHDSGVAGRLRDGKWYTRRLGLTRSRFLDGAATRQTHQDTIRGKTRQRATRTRNSSATRSLRHARGQSRAPDSAARDFATARGDSRTEAHWAARGDAGTPTRAIAALQDCCEPSEGGLRSPRAVPGLCAISARFCYDFASRRPVLAMWSTGRYRETRRARFGRPRGVGEMSE